MKKCSDSSSEPGFEVLDPAHDGTGVGSKLERPFAHPVERALAHVFDQFGISWRYEPRTFPLEWEDGRVIEACTPDFYLPELDMYVECTVMKQDYVTRKNRKYRKLRERFGVVAEIMYRRDFIRLGRRHGLAELEQALD
jgi:hypoxanthine phosphoribosyltransferase